MFAGPSLPYELSESVMAPSPDGGGVILFGGYNYEKREREDTLLELRYDSKNWTQLSHKLDQPRSEHVVITHHLART